MTVSRVKNYVRVDGRVVPLVTAVSRMLQKGASGPDIKARFPSVHKRTLQLAITRARVLTGLRTPARRVVLEGRSMQVSEAVAVLLKKGMRPNQIVAEFPDYEPEGSLRAIISKTRYKLKMPVFKQPTSIERYLNYALSSETIDYYDTRALERETGAGRLMSKILAAVAKDDLIEAVLDTKRSKT